MFTAEGIEKKIKNQNAKSKVTEQKSKMFFQQPQ
jgi:hypothetical protein